MSGGQKNETMNYVKRYSEMLRSKGMRFELVNGVLFVRRDHWVTPIGPAAQTFHLDKVQSRDLLHKLGGLWVMWTEGFESTVHNSEWYAVICRQHKAVETVISGNTRSKIRRGLKNCEVRKVDAREIAQNGYETYCAALDGYGKDWVTMPSAEEFARSVMRDEPFGDILHQWGVYHEGQMIGFSQNLLYDKIEVDYTHIKLHPKYLNKYSSYALFYCMNEYYLAHGGFKYVNDGFRSISHVTGIQDFLIKEFGFEKTYTELHVYYMPPIGKLLQMACPFRAFAKALYPKADAMFELDRLRIRP